MNAKHFIIFSIEAGVFIQQGYLLGLPAIAAMHGPHSVFDIHNYTVIHCDAAGVSLTDQRKAEKN